MNEQDEIFTMTAEERAARRAARIAARRAREKARRNAMFKRSIPVFVLIVAVVSGLARYLFKPDPNAKDAEPDAIPASMSLTPEELPQDVPEAPPEPPIPFPQATPQTLELGDTVNSQYAVFLNADTHEIIAQKGADEIISPASMTKLLTVLTASDTLKDRDFSQDTVTIDLSITDVCFVDRCSVAGYALEEEVPVRDLFFGTILPSGADAALALATYTAGSQEAFVELMNEKAEELGLSETAHFTNCIGLYNEANVCTVKDMAVILQAALEDPLCREAISTRFLVTGPTEKHPDGLELSNWFLRRIEDRDCGEAVVMGAKTGYVTESGNCAASYGKSPDGTMYICVTGDAQGQWKCINDHAYLYKTYAQ